MRVRHLVACCGLIPLVWTAPAGATEQFDCVIEPSRIVRVGSPVTGVLTDVRVGRGDWVRRGDVLARLEDRLERATVDLQEMRASDESSLQAQAARLRLAKERMDRISRLKSRGAATVVAFEEAEAELAVNAAELERLRMEGSLAKMEVMRGKAALSLRTIEASLDGIVVERVLSAGEFVNQDAVILRIADVDPLNIEVYLPIAYFSQMAVGDVGRITPLEPSDRSFEGKVTVIDRVFDAASNTFGMRLALDNPEGLVPAGQRCSVELEIEAVAVQ